MARVKCEGKKYESIKGLRLSKQITDVSSIDTPITIRFTKHDIGTWTAYIEELGFMSQGSTPEDALFQLLCKNFGEESK
jgi:hypothetical protein